MLVFRLHRRVESSCAQVRHGILMERRCKLEAKQGGKTEMNLHG
jgi:hypothetical protein